ncbi:hypothetical protein JKF63_06396 [Porcisia hertigi]|uniref:Uncharacterized protein n=1 Tax=Porcisia hertigi TaxID=2761500 RepID=A0A836LJV2_9TRYP|nr:hypothetical protein JKF63_06396 [Porcisia hertigi]
MGVLFLAANYAVFYYVGELLMRLVVVQPLSGAKVVRWCFASTFALSLSLFSAVLVDMADASIFHSTTTFLAATAAEGGAGRIEVASSEYASWPWSTVLLLHSLLLVNAQSFTWLLLFLLSTVLVACPTVFVVSVLRHAFVRGRQAASRQRSTSRRFLGSISGYAGFGASHRCSGRFDSRLQLKPCSSSRGHWAGTKGSRGLCGSLYCVLVCLLLVSFLCGGVWTAHTRQSSVLRVVRQASSIAALQRFYAVLQSVTATLSVPQEIKMKSTSAASGGPPPSCSHQEAVQRGKRAAEGVPEASADPVVATLADTKADVLGDGADVPGQARRQQMPQRRLPGTGAVHSTSAIIEGLHAFVCAVTSRVATVGVAMIGLLSGYAAITSPCLFLAPYTYWRGREEELWRAQLNFNKKLCYVLNGYGAAQRQIAALQYSLLHEEGSPSVFSGAGSSGLPPRYASLPSGQSSAVYSSGNCDDSLSRNCFPYPGSDSSGGTGPYRVRDGSWGGSDLWQSTGLANHRPVQPHQAQCQVSMGAVKWWIQKKLSNAARVVVGGASEDSRGGRFSPKSLTAAASNPAPSRQWAVERIRTLRGEAAASRYLSLSMYLQLHEVASMVHDAQRGSTWIGRCYAGLGVVMALYSTVKILLTVASLWLFKASTQDPVTRAVTLLENAFILRRRDAQSGVSFSVTAVEVSTHVILALALAVNAWMVVNSVRGVLLALFHVTMSFSGSAISRPETIAVGLSMMIGVYFIGQLVMLRSSLPGIVLTQLDGVPSSVATPTPNVLLAVLGSLPYYYYQRLNDSCFLVGCCGAVIMRVFVMRNAVSSAVYTASGGE